MTADHPSPGSIEFEQSAARTVEEIERILKASPELGEHLRHFEPGACIMREGEANHALFVLLEGSLTLFKRLPEGGRLEVSKHRRGELVGVHSFATDNRSLCTAQAQKPVRAICLGPSLLDSLPTAFPELHRLVQRLIVANLAGRYRSAVNLQIELSEANRELTETRNRLIHQEKLATLGQLAAGIAHEVNNPVSAMQRHADTLLQLLPELLERAAPKKSAAYWEAGLASAGTISGQRDAMELLAQNYSAHPRALLRRVAALPEALHAGVLGKPGSSRAASKGLVLLAIFECAFLLRHLDASASQVAHIVAKLKEYARPVTLDLEEVDISESIENTFVVLNPLISRHDLHADLPTGLMVEARGASLAQIWTNLIKNACEAMDYGGELHVRAFADGQNVIIEIADKGPGIPDFLRKRVFEVNFTTKTGDENFGLGLGLSITRSLVKEHNGTLQIFDTPGGGCTFRVSLPRHPPAL